MLSRFRIARGPPGLGGAQRRDRTRAPARLDARPRSPRPALCEALDKGPPAPACVKGGGSTWALGNYRGGERRSRAVITPAGPRARRSNQPDVAPKRRRYRSCTSAFGSAPRSWGLARPRSPSMSSHTVLMRMVGSSAQAALRTSQNVLTATSPGPGDAALDTRRASPAARANHAQNKRSATLSKASGSHVKDSE